MRSTRYLTSYLFQDAYCELCNFDYPNTVLNFWGKPFALINFDENENLNLMVLE